jgi:hypothetical protein
MGGFSSDNSARQSTLPDRPEIRRSARVAPFSMRHGGSRKKTRRSAMEQKAYGIGPKIGIDFRKA